MPIAEWENLTVLVSLEGNLTLNDKGNAEGFGYYLTAKDGAESGSGVRATGDPVPQGAGTIWHRGFANGYLVKVPVFYWVDENTPATKLTAPTAQQMDDLLMKHVWSIISGGGRILYDPAGEPRRLLDQLQLIAEPTLTEGDGQSGTILQLGSPFPYLFDFTEITTTLTDGSPTATLTNDGSAAYYPVFKVHGPFSDFILTNTTLGQQIAYDDSLPGAVAVAAGHYIEINTFNNTVYLDGSGASRKAGIDILTSEFFTLAVGDNALAITSAGAAPDVDVLWAAAWA